jgi:hypothetical protein
MDVDRLEVRKIIEQEVKPNESLIVWSDMYMRYIKKTFEEQTTVYEVDPQLAKERLITYITERMQNELRTD